MRKAISKVTFQNWTRSSKLHLLDLLSARRETHCLNFTRSLLKSERIKMLIPPADRRFMSNSLEIAPTSPNYVRALTDSLKAPFPSTLACLIPPSLPLGGSCVAPTLGVVFGFLFCLPLLTFCCLYIVLFLCLYDAIRPLGCYVMLLKSYHIISYHIISYHIISYHIISYHIISYLKFVARVKVLIISSQMVSFSLSWAVLVIFHKKRVSENVTKPSDLSVATSTNRYKG